MSKLYPIFKQIFILPLLLVLAFGMPAATYADSLSAQTGNTAAPVVAPAATDSQATPAATTPPADASVSKPTGASADTYHYNQTAGLWENAHFTWDPVAGVPVPKIQPTYTYNGATDNWDTNLWLYDAASDTFVSTPTSVAVPPTGALTSGGPATTAPTPTTTTPPVTSTAPASTGSSVPVPATPIASVTPTTTTSQPIAVKQPDKTTTSNVTLSTTVGSLAQSGDALLQNNNKAGDATTGDASAEATVLNLLQSSSALSGSGVTTFTKDIQGSDMPGDFVIDPASFLQSADTQAPAGLAVSSQTTGTIQNNIDLSAHSGNATILDNKKAGDATTGNASAVANVMNMINSVVAANQSFLGVINIYGDYTGNILVPTDSLQTLLGSNTPGSTTGVAASGSDVSTSSTQAIANNVDLSATSGDAAIADNKKAGNAATGNAMTNLTILNLTGHQVTAANSLLVFVNVLGTWVGVIMDAPTGTTAAALTGGDVSAVTAAVTANDAASSPDATIADDSSITNNITARAQSGDASLTSNKKAGNATTGSATASANILNIINSTFSLSHWFGVLFINVFGSWHGSVAAETPAATPTTSDGGTSTSTNPIEAVKVFGFSQAGSGLGLSHIPATNFADNAQYDALVSSVGKVLAAHDIVNKVAQQKQAAAVQHQARFSLSVLPVALGITGLTAVGAERVKSIRRKFSFSNPRLRR